jgi:hypothetical protein
VAERPKPSPKQVADMLGEVGGLAYEMADGWVRFLLDHDVAAGRASDTAMRSLLEFLVGRKRRWPNDFRPSDAHDHWQVDDAEVEHLRRQLRYLDQRLAHLSLARATPSATHPQRWANTVVQVLELTRRYADDIRDHPAYARLAVPLANADDRMATLLQRRPQPRPRTTVVPLSPQLQPTAAAG